VIAVAMDLPPMKANTNSQILTGQRKQSVTDKKQPLPWLLTNYKKELQNGKKATNQLSQTV
jgi:hypothetical protein